MTRSECALKGLFYTIAIVAVALSLYSSPISMAQGIPAIDESWDPHTVLVADLDPRSGFEWDDSLEDILSDECVAGNPSTMVDDDGKLWLCWQSDHMLYVATRSTQDLHWRIQSLIRDPTQLLDEPHMCQGPGGKLFLAYSTTDVEGVMSTWTGNGIGDNGGNGGVPSKAIHVVSSSDGVVWSEPEVIASDPLVNNANPWITWADDELLVVWDSDLGTQKRDLSMSSSTDGTDWGDSWAPFSSDDDIDRDPAMVYSGGVRYMVWSTDEFDDVDDPGDQLSDQLAYSVSAGNARSWTPPAAVRERFSKESSPSLCVDMSGDPFLAWSSDRGLHDDMESEKEHSVNIWYSSFLEGGWTLPTPLTFGDAFDATPTVTSVGGRLYVVWERDDHFIGTSSDSPVYIHQLKPHMALDAQQWVESFDDSFSGNIAKTFVIDNKEGRADLEGTLVWTRGFTCDRDAFSVPPSGNVTFTVTLNTAQIGEYIGTVVLETNDEDYQTVVIPLEVTVKTHEIEPEVEIPDGEVVTDDDGDLSALLWYLEGIALVTLIAVILLVLRRRGRRGRLTTSREGDSKVKPDGSRSSDGPEDVTNEIISVMCVYLMITAACILPLAMAMAAADTEGTERIMDQEAKTIILWAPYYNDSAEEQVERVDADCTFKNATSAKYTVNSVLRQRVEVPYPVLGLRFNMSTESENIPFVVRITDEETMNTEWFEVDYGGPQFGWSEVDLRDSRITNRPGGAVFTVTISPPLGGDYGSSETYRLKIVDGTGSDYPRVRRAIPSARSLHVEEELTSDQWWTCRDKECLQRLTEHNWRTIEYNLKMELRIRGVMLQSVYLDRQVFSRAGGHDLKASIDVTNPFADEEDFTMKVGIVGPDGDERLIYEEELNIASDEHREVNISYPFPEELPEGKYYVVAGIYVVNETSGGPPLMVAKWGGNGDEIGTTTFSFSEKVPIKSVELVKGAHVPLEEGKTYVYLIACDDAPGLDLSLLEETTSVLDDLAATSGTEIEYRTISDTRALDELVNSDLEDAIVINGHGEVLPIPQSFTMGEHVTEDLVALYRFDAANGTRVYDRSNFLNDGEFVGGPEWTRACHEGISALSFDGVGDMVKVANDSSLRNPSFTVDFWVYFDTDHSEGLWTMLAYEGVNRGWSFGLDQEGEFVVDNRLTFSVGNGQTLTTLYGGQVESGEWHRVTGVYDGEVASLYLDNARQDSEKVGAIVYADGPLTIGGSILNPDRLTRVVIDDVVISHDARAPTATTDGDPRDGMNWVKRLGLWIAEKGITFVNAEGCPFSYVGNMELRWTDNVMLLGSDAFGELLATRCTEAPPRTNVPGTVYDPTPWISTIEGTLGTFDPPDKVTDDASWSLPPEMATFSVPLYQSGTTGEISNALVFYGDGAIMFNGIESAHPGLIAGASLWWAIDQRRPLYVIACEDAPGHFVPETVVDDTMTVFDAISKDLGITFHYVMIDSTEELDLLVGSAMANTIVVNTHGEVVPVPASYVNGSAVIEGTRAVYKFEEGVGRTVHDATDAHFDGVVVGAQWTTNAPFGEHALSFDGVDDYLLVGRNPELSPDKFTIELSLWLEREYPTEAATIISNEWFPEPGSGLDGSFGFSLEVDPNSGPSRLTNNLVLNVGKDNDTRARLVSGVRLDKERWYRIRASYDGADLRLYVDYEEVASMEVSGLHPSSVTGLYVGAAPLNRTSHVGPAHHINATVDDITIYAGERSPDMMRLDTVAWEDWVERIVDWISLRGVIWTELAGKELRFIGLDGQDWDADMVHLPDAMIASLSDGVLLPLYPDFNYRDLQFTDLGDKVSEALPSAELPDTVTCNKNLPGRFDLTTIPVYSDGEVVSHALVAMGSGFMIHSGSYEVKVASACAAWAYSHQVHMTYFLDVPSTVTVREPKSVSSDHPYPKNSNRTWAITIDDALKLRVHFTRIRIEAPYDVLEVLDGNGMVVADYSYEDDIWTPWIEGDTIWVRLQSDSVAQFWGFGIDASEHLEIRGDVTPVDAGEVSDMFDQIALGSDHEYVYKEVTSTSDFERLVRSQLEASIVINLHGDVLPVPDTYLADYSKGMVLSATLENDVTGPPARIAYSFSNESYTLSAGDVLEYDIMLESTNPSMDCAGVDLLLSDESYLCQPASVQDQNKVRAAPGTDLGAYADGVWYHRIIEVPAWAHDKTVESWEISCQGNDAGTYAVHLDNVRVVNTTTTMVTAYDDTLTTSVTVGTFMHFESYSLNTARSDVSVEDWVNTVADWIASTGTIFASPQGHPFFYGLSDGMSDKWEIGEEGWDEFLDPRLDYMIMEEAPDGGFQGEMTWTARKVNELVGMLPDSVPDVPIAIPEFYDCIAFYREPGENVTTHGILPFGRGAYVFCGAYSVEVLAMMCTMYSARHDDLMFIENDYYKGDAIRTEVKVLNDQEETRSYSIGLVVTFSAEGLRSQQLMDELKVTLAPGEGQTLHLTWTPSHRFDIGSYKLVVQAVDLETAFLAQKWGAYPEDGVLDVSLNVKAFLAGVSSVEYYSFFETLTFDVTIVNEMYMDLDFAISGMFVNSETRFVYWTDIFEYQVRGLERSVVTLYWTPSDQNYDNQSFVAGTFEGSVHLEDAVSVYYVADTTQKSEEARYVRKASYLDESRMTFSMASEIQITFPSALGEWEVSTNGTLGPFETIDPAVSGHLSITEPDSKVCIRKVANDPLPEGEKGVLDDSTCFSIRYLAYSGDALYTMVNAGDWEHNQAHDWNHSSHVQRVLRVPGDGSPTDYGDYYAYRWEAGTELIIAREPYMSFSPTDCAYLHNVTPENESVISYKEVQGKKEVVVLEDALGEHGSAVTYSMELNEANFYTLSLEGLNPSKGTVEVKVHLRYHTGDENDVDSLGTVGYLTDVESPNVTWDGDAGLWETKNVNLCLAPNSYLITLEYISSDDDEQRSVYISGIIIQPQLKLGVETEPAETSFGGDDDGPSDPTKAVATQAVNTGFKSATQPDWFWNFINNKDIIPVFKALSVLEGAELPLGFIPKQVLRVSFWTSMNETDGNVSTIGAQLKFQGEIPIPSKNAPVVILSYDLTLKVEWKRDVPGNSSWDKITWYVGFRLKISFPLGWMVGLNLHFTVPAIRAGGSDIVLFRFDMDLYIDLDFNIKVFNDKIPDKVEVILSGAIGLRFQVDIKFTVSLNAIIKGLIGTKDHLEKKEGKVTKDLEKAKDDLQEAEMDADTAITETPWEYSDQHEKKIEELSKKVTDGENQIRKIGVKKTKCEKWSDLLKWGKWIKLPSLEIKFSFIIGSYFGVAWNILSGRVLLYGEFFLSLAVKVDIVLFKISIGFFELSIKIPIELALTIDKIFWYAKLGTDKAWTNDTTDGWCWRDRNTFQQDEQAMFAYRPVDTESRWFLKICYKVIFSGSL